MPERLYTTTKAGELLGLNRDDVLRLGRLGQLKLVTQVLRGRNVKPRRYVSSSEIDRYIKSRSDAAESLPAVEPVERKVSRAKTGLAAELAAAPRYLRR